MKNFLVSNTVKDSGDINIGIAPGKFDTKQLILSAIAVLAFSSDEKIVRFIRTVEREELSKCRFFINDDFTTMFPVIPSFHDVIKTWEKNSEKILSKYAVQDVEIKNFINDSVKEKICNLEPIDCIMELYEFSSANRDDSFTGALKVTLKLIERFITDSISERMYFLTVKAYMQKATSNYVELPIYVQGWRNIVSNVETERAIEYAIFPEPNDIYIIESFNKDLIMKKYVKGMEGVCYSGRFFIKVTDMETAIKVIEKLPKGAKSSKEKFA